jgi:hypothetical protein
VNALQVSVSIVVLALEPTCSIQAFDAGRPLMRKAKSPSELALGSLDTWGRSIV